VRLAAEIRLRGPRCRRHRAMLAGAVQMIMQALACSRFKLMPLRRYAIAICA
jgi:hypothetical protein